MKRTLKNLDVDFIGEQPQQSMTKEEALKQERKKDCKNSLLKPDKIVLSFLSPLK